MQSAEMHGACEVGGEGMEREGDEVRCGGHVGHAEEEEVEVVRARQEDGGGPCTGKSCRGRRDDDTSWKTEEYLEMVCRARQEKQDMRE